MSNDPHRVGCFPHRIASLFLDVGLNNLYNAAVVYFYRAVHIASNLWVRTRGANRKPTMETGHFSSLSCEQTRKVSGETCFLRC